MYIVPLPNWCVTFLNERRHKHPIDSNKSPTRCNSFPVYYPDSYLQLNKLKAFSRPSSGAQWLQLQPLVLPSYRGDSRAVFVVGPAGLTTNTVQLSPWYEGKTRGYNCSHWAPDDGRENARNLLSCKHQDNKLENCCIRLVIYLNCLMMHGLQNLKSHLLWEFRFPWLWIWRCGPEWYDTCILVVGPSTVFVPVCLMSQQHIPKEHNFQPSYYIIVL
jgi:hypothetical protein